MQLLNPFGTRVESLTRQDRRELRETGMKWNLRHAFTDADYRNYMTVQQAVLRQAQSQGRITADQFHQVRDCRIHWKSQTVVFTIPGTSHKVSFGFEEISDAGAKTALNALIDRANAGNFYKTQFKHVSDTPIGKGNPHGTVPLQRKSEAAQKLTTTISDAKQNLLPRFLSSTPDVATARREVVKRMEHADFVIYRMKGELDAKIREKAQAVQQIEGANPQPTDAAAQITRLRGEIQQLQALREKFETVDCYALTTALAKLPPGQYSYADLARATQEVHSQVAADLNGNTTRSFKRLGRKATLDQTDQAYIRGVAGLLHRTRGEYSAYCKSQNMRPQKESLEDLIIGEAVRVAYGKPYDDGAIRRSQLLSSMTPELQAEVAGMFDKIDRLASVSEDFPRDTRDYAGTDEGAIRTAITSRFGDLTMDRVDAPARPGPIPTTNTGAAVVAAGLGAVALDRLTGGRVTPHVRDGAQYVVDHPGQALGAAFMGYTGLNHVRRVWSNLGEVPYVAVAAVPLTGFAMHMMGTTDPSDVMTVAMANPQYTVAAIAAGTRATRAIHDFVRPVEEGTGLDHSRRRQWNYRNVAIVGTAGVATYMAAAQLYNYYQTGDEEDYPHWAMGYVTGAVDGVWNHFILAGMALPVLQRGASYLPAVGNVASGTFGVLRDVAGAAQMHHFFGRFYNMFGGSAPAVTGGLNSESTVEVEEILEDGRTVPIPRFELDPTNVANATLDTGNRTYTLMGRPVSLAPHITDVTADDGGVVELSTSTLRRVADATTRVATEAVGAASSAIGEGVATMADRETVVAATSNRSTAMGMFYVMLMMTVLFQVYSFLGRSTTGY